MDNEKDQKRIGNNENESGVPFERQEIDEAQRLKDLAEKERIEKEKVEKAKKIKQEEINALTEKNRINAEKASLLLKEEEKKRKEEQKKKEELMNIKDREGQKRIEAQKKKMIQEEKEKKAEREKKIKMAREAKQAKMKVAEEERKKQIEEREKRRQERLAKEKQRNEEKLLKEKREKKKQMSPLKKAIETKTVAHTVPWNPSGGVKKFSTFSGYEILKPLTPRPEKCEKETVNKTKKVENYQPPMRVVPVSKFDPSPSVAKTYQRKLILKQAVRSVNSSQTGRSSLSQPMIQSRPPVIAPFASGGSFNPT